MSDKKICPLMGVKCKEGECAWWAERVLILGERGGEFEYKPTNNCAIKLLAEK